MNSTVTMPDCTDGRIDAVRAFNRFYTDVIGVLGEGLLDSNFSLTEVRVLFEINVRGEMEVAELRQLLHLDAGYLSRILRRFEAEGLATRERSPVDGRRQIVRLTETGSETYSDLDQRSAKHVATMLEGLSDVQQQELVSSMQRIERVLRPTGSPRTVLLRPLRCGDYGWVVHRHGEVYRREHGFDETFESLVARIVADYVESGDRQRQGAWIAEVDGERAGSIFCARHDDRTAQLRLLLVEPNARGLGVGSRLVEQCVRFARDAGYESIMLWTNDILHDARRVYERAGFTLTREEPHHSYGCQLMGQYWSRPL